MSCKCDDSDWVKVKVGELGRIVTGKTPKTSVSANYGGRIPFLTPSDDMSKKYAEATKRTLSTLGVQEVKNRLLPQGAVCVSCIGSDLGKAIITSQPTVTNQQINSIVVNSTRFDVDFVYYAMLILGKTLNYISKTSTAVPIINKASFSEYEISVPPLNIQKKISSFMNALDSKITLNQRINDNLQQQARALFESWFVDCETTDWRKGRLKDVLCLKRDSIKDVNKNTSLPYLPIDSIPMNTFAISEVRPNEEAKSSLVAFNKDDIIIGAMRVYFHRVIPAPFDGITRNTCFTLTPYDPDYFCFALLLCDQESSIQYAQKTSKGSTMPYAIWDSGLGDMSIGIPPKEVASAFNRAVFPLIRKIQSSFFENKRLKEIRDTLLPRLMSGELDVSGLDI